MILQSVRHLLSFSVRFVDHFSQELVAIELPVRLDKSFLRPVQRPDGLGYRQNNGAYRFIDAPNGLQRILWRLPFTTHHAGWTRWQPDPQVRLPVVNPSQLIDVELWPTANAVAPPSATGVRGRLLGTNSSAQVVRLARQGEVFGRFTRTDENGEFLFLFASTLTADAVGRIPASISVLDTTGASRLVSGGNFVPGSAGTSFVGGAFNLTPRTVPRILFQLA